MDRRVILVLGILGVAGFGYWYYTHQQSKNTEQPTDFNYTNQPDLPVSENQSVFVNGSPTAPNQNIVAQNSQAFPYPYNT